MEKIKICNLSFAYPETQKNVLNNLNLDINQGDFVVICGPSGCGKSTLLRQLKSCLAPKGKLSGEILFDGENLNDISERKQSEKIGFVQQSPDNQIVTDKVWHELAFGLESLGYDTPTIRNRVAEMANFFGIEKWFYKKVTELSGGQKQLLNLASIMVMQPDVLILDEPTSQLDPIAASDFIATIGKINRELGTTVVLTEHRLEETFPLASKAAVMDEGSMIFVGTPKEAALALKEKGHSMFLAMPAAMRIWASTDDKSPSPITVNEGREWLDGYINSCELRKLPKEEKHSYQDGIALDLKDVWFRYEEHSLDVVRGLSFSVHKGEFVTILGGNGAGKSTTLGLMGGLLKPVRGSIEVNGRLATLPQNPQTIFVKNTVRSDLFEIFRGTKISKEEQEEAVKHIVSICKLEELLDRHPYDLSGGEQQRAALAKVLLLGPDILLLDEPTKGLDAEFKEEFAKILKVLLSQGVTIVMVSHDIEFSAKYAARCCMFFDGAVASEGSPRTFFCGNSFYTTSAAKIARGKIEDAVTAEDVMYAIGGRLPEEPKLAEDIPTLPKPAEASKDYKPKPFPLWRKILAAVSLCAAIVIIFQSLGVTDLSSFVGNGGLTNLAGAELYKYLAAILCLVIFAFSVGRKSAASLDVPTQLEKRQLSKRTLVATVLIIICIPLTLFIGSYYFSNQRYYLFGLIILLECMIPFFLVFEGRKPKARELVLLASLAALNVAGRTLFFMLPEFKPIFALTIISGVALGGETGFLVGAMTMLVSNIVFGQGPWTPWQMFALGIIGFLAGVLFRKGLLRRSKTSLAVFGAFTSIVIYGGIMNPAAALIWAGGGGASFNFKSLLAYYITGFPIDCVRGIATAAFLWLLAEPMLEKLDRIKTKYGLV